MSESGAYLCLAGVAIGFGNFLDWLNNKEVTPGPKPTTGEEASRSGKPKQKVKFGGEPVSKIEAGRDRTFSARVCEYKESDVNNRVSEIAWSDAPETDANGREGYDLAKLAMDRFGSFR